MNLHRATTTFWTIAFAARRAPGPDTAKHIEAISASVTQPKLQQRIRELQEPPRAA